MSLNKLSPGRDVPDNINVVIEIPANGSPVKYEVDKETGTLLVDRFLNVAMYYPCNYGYVPQTLAEDDDPVDVLVITPAPLLSGSIINCRPIGLLKMEDESGPDSKLLAVPVDKLCQNYHDVQTTNDLPSYQLDMIAHFFERYKDLEKNKWVKVEGWTGPEEAKQEILDSIQRYKENG